MARHENDAYDTDPALALACARWAAAYLTLSDTPNVLDPMAGTGPWVKAARETWPAARVAAIDIRPADQIPQLATAGANFVKCDQDCFALPPAMLAKIDLVLTNPAFKDADRLVRYLWPHLKDGASIALLLNITFLGSAERWIDEAAKEAERGDVALFNLAPLRFCAPIVPRPSFIVVDGKDSSAKFEAGLLCWTKGWAPMVATGYTENDIFTAIPSPIRWEKPKKARGPRGPRKENTP